MQQAVSEESLKVIVFQGVQNLPLFAAESKGFFVKRGLKVEVEATPNSQVLRDGLAQGRYQIAHTAVDNAVAMVELAKADVSVVMGGDNGFNDLFFQPDIRSYADLRGKTVLVDAPNTAFALVLYQILRQHGLERGDYVVKPIGGTHLRLAAMEKDKSAAAAILNLPFSVLAERAGLRNMGETIKAIGPYQSTAGFVMRAWGQANADILVRYIQAYVEGLRWAVDPANKPAAIDLLVSRLHLAPDIATRSYEIAAAPETGFAKDAAIDLAGLRNVLKLRAEIEGQWGGKPPAPERYLDLSYYQRAIAGM